MLGRGRAGRSAGSAPLFARAIRIGKVEMMTLDRRKQSARPLTVTDPVILIRINRLYRDGMTEDELYDATRSCWKLGSRRNLAKYALAVFEGVVREVYEIAGWHEGGSTPCKSGIHKKPRTERRWEFTGQKAEDSVRSRYVGRSVAGYFTQGQQNPVKYVNV